MERNRLCTLSCDLSFPPVQNVARIDAVIGSTTWRDAPASATEEYSQAKLVDPPEILHKALYIELSEIILT